VIRTVVVEDDPVLAEAHRVFTERVPGFTVAATAHLGTEALRIVATCPVDLMLLDINLPDMSGIDLCRALRARGNELDVIAVTSARDLATVRGAVSLGVTQYLLKPFSFSSFRDKLHAYAEYRRRAACAPETLAQADVDSALEALRGTHAGVLPKGLTDATLASVVAVMRSGERVSATRVAVGTGISVQTARRYLAYLARQRLAIRAPAYGGTGRPEHLYTWTGAGL
jgi:response regulator of citrate/malate metabolism